MSGGYSANGIQMSCESGNVAMLYLGNDAFQFWKTDKKKKPPHTQFFS